MRWTFDRIVHFDPASFVNGGYAHFGFHDRRGRLFAIDHEKHFLGLVGADGNLEWTVAAQPVFAGVPNIVAELEFPMYVDVLLDGTLVASNFLSARLYRIDAERMAAELLVEGHDLGMTDMGNCVVDDAGCIWVNEVTGCRVWRFDAAGSVMHVLGNGSPGFQLGEAGSEEAAFSRIYDIRRGPDGDIYVLDSGNFALRAIDIAGRRVRTLAGTGASGYAGDGGDAHVATFGSDPTAVFDGPISLSVDEHGNAFVGDRFNHVVRMIERASGTITTIAGHRDAQDDTPNDPGERDPLALNLPKISSMDYHAGRLFVPTDLSPGHGDLVVLRMAELN